MADTKKEFTEPDWDPWYEKMLNAVSEYLGGIDSVEDSEDTDRDIRIIKALIDFYGFDSDEIADILDDVDKLEDKRKENANH